MEFEMTDAVSGLLGLGLLGFLIYVIRVIMVRDDDVGNVVTKKISNQTMFLLEIVLILVNGAEMLTAVSVQAVNTAFEISHSGRYVLHGSFALISILGGFSFTKQLKEAFANPKRPSQWIQAILSFGLVLLGPFINLIAMAYSMNQLSILRGYKLIETFIGTDEDGNDIWEDTKVYKGLIDNIDNGLLDPTLFITLCITIAHVFLVLVICSVAYDKVYKLDGSGKKEKDKPDEKDEDEDEPEDAKKDKKEIKLSITDSLKIVADASNNKTDVISLTIDLWQPAIERSKYKDQLKGRLANLAGNIKRIDNLMNVKSGDQKAIEDLKVQKTKHERNVQKFLSDLENK